MSLARNWCWLLGHSWEKWHRATYRIDTTISGVVVGEPRDVLYQVRACTLCGLQQSRPL